MKTFTSAIAVASALFAGLSIATPQAIPASGKYLLKSSALPASGVNNLYGELIASNHKEII
jgi:hypothetical protein